MITLTKVFRVGGTLTNATSFSVWVKRNDTSADVIGTSGSPEAMTNTSTGYYQLSFTEPAPGLAYTATYTAVYASETVSFVDIFSGTLSAGGTPLTVTYSTLQREVGRFLGYGRDPLNWTADAQADVADILQSGVRRVITPPPIPGEKYAHEWSFLRPTATFTTTIPVGTSVDGSTITIVDGVIALSGGTFPSWAAQGSIAVPTGTYLVSVRNSGTQLTLSDTSVNVSAGTSYTLSQTVYAMPADFADIDGPLVYATGQTILRNRVDRTSEYQLLMDMAYEVTPSYPRTYALRVQKNPTPPPTLVMTAATGYELLLCPSPDAAYALFYKYRVAIPALDGTLTTPPGGDAHGELYLESCLAAAEQKLQDTVGIHSARFMECLIASVSFDRKMNCSQTLGFNRDTSDRMGFDLDDHFFTQPQVTSYSTGGTRYP